MPRKYWIILSASILILLLATACGAVSNEESPQEDPQVEPIEENQPMNLQGDNNEPTRNETDGNFGEELDEDTEDSIPEEYLEKDEETESGT